MVSGAVHLVKILLQIHLIPYIANKHSNDKIRALALRTERERIRVVLVFLIIKKTTYTIPNFLLFNLSSFENHLTII